MAADALFLKTDFNCALRMLPSFIVFVCQIAFIAVEISNGKLIYIFYTQHKTYDWFERLIT